MSKLIHTLSNELLALILEKVQLLALLKNKLLEKYLHIYIAQITRKKDLKPYKKQLQNEGLFNIVVEGMEDDLQQISG
jgi:hypothetical protein